MPLLYLERRDSEMFREARDRAELSRQEAAFQLHIGNRTLNNYEHGITITPPEIALRMGEIYHDPILTERYCSDYCPIGQIYAHSVPEHQSLCQAVLGLLKEQNDVEQIRAKLIEITADGVIDMDEIPIFEGIIDELLDLEKKIEEVKMQAALIMSIPAMMQKRKKTALVAAR